MATTCFETYLSDALLIVGAVLEIVGVFLMSGAYLSATRLRDRLPILGNALVRGNTAKGAVEVSELNKTQKVSALQGLAFIGLGFILQTGVLSWRFFSALL